MPTDSGAASADSFGDEENMAEHSDVKHFDTKIDSASKSSRSTKYSTYMVSGSYARIKNGTVNMRTKPGTAFRVITSIPVGTTVTFNGLGATNRDGSKWYQVQYEGKTGWISQKYATIIDSIDDSEISAYPAD